MRLRLVALMVIVAACGQSPPRAAPTATSPTLALEEPFDVLAERGGTFLIADRRADAVLRLRGLELTTVAKLPGPRDLEPAGDGRVLVASGRNVVALDPGTGATETVATVRGAVLGVARGPRGELYVSDNGSRVLRVDKRRVIAKGLDGVHGLLVTPEGLVVCESSTGRVLLYTRAGRRRVLAAGLDLPSFAALVDDALYVSEFGAGRITRIENGRVRAIAELPDPTALSVAEDGTLLAAGLRGDVAHVDPATGRVVSLVS